MVSRFRIFNCISTIFIVIVITGKSVYGGGVPLGGFAKTAWLATRSAPTKGSKRSKDSMASGIAAVVWEGVAGERRWCMAFGIAEGRGRHDR